MTTTNVLSAIEQTFADRAAKRAAALSEATKQVRRTVAAIATGENPPDDEVLAVLDQLGVDHIWLKGAVGIAIEHKKQVEGLARVPGLKERAEALESEAKSLEIAGEKAKQVAEQATHAIVNQGDRTFSPWRSDATVDELSARRDAISKHLEICDRFWLATRDAAAIRDEIKALEKIDQSLIDHTCGEPAGKDFRLPPIG